MSVIENPFADYGKIVHGERFIGRRQIIRVIENRIIKPKDPGNLAIIGMHRIGKSSLAYKTIIELRDKLIAKNVLPIWIGLSSYNQSSDFFHDLVTECIYEMEDVDWISDRIQSLADLALNASDPWRQIKRFFKKVREAGYSILFILDEFDRARLLFKGDTAFQRLRELADYPDYGLSLVLTSRRNIRDIEHAAGSNSPFHNIFQVQRLGMFSREDLDAYYSLFSTLRIPIPSTFRERVSFYCGTHPYLLEMLGCEIVERFRETQEIDVDKAAEIISQSIFEHYDDTIELLREEGNLNKLIQILFGPVIDIKQTDVTELQNYGLIKPNHAGTYDAYSEHFHDYLKLYERSTAFATDLWAIWRDTEKALREVITITMLDTYGTDWIDRLAKERPNLKRVFDDCRSAQLREEKSFGDRASRDLIDFTYPGDLFEIICARGLWEDFFEPIFGRDKAYWNERKALLSRCRNPLAHNRDEILQPHERKTIEGYCEEILSCTTNIL